MRNSLRLAAVGVALVMASMSLRAQAGGPSPADDAALALPDQPASDDVLKKQAGTPPQGSAANGTLVQAATVSPLAPPPQLPGGTASTISTNISTTSISTLSATVSNNDFHN